MIANKPFVSGRFCLIRGARTLAKAMSPGKLTLRCKTRGLCVASQRHNWPLMRVFARYPQKLWISLWILS